MKTFKTRKKKKNIKKLLFITIIIISFILGTIFLSSLFDNQKFISILLDTSIKNSNYKSISPIYDYLLDYTIGRMQYKDEDYIGSLSSNEYTIDPNPKENKTNPIVYIYNTHQGEEYKGGTIIDHDITPTVMLMSYYLREKLNKENIPSIVETNNISEILRTNNWDYNSSYKASRLLLENAYKNNSSLEYFIDLHRDTNPYQTSFIDYNNKRYAKVLFVIGKNFNGYEHNQELALKLNEILEKYIPGISRGILNKNGKYVNGIYNEDFHPHVILIELGSVYNSIEEVSNTTEIISQAIKKLIKGD